MAVWGHSVVQYTGRFATSRCCIKMAARKDFSFVQLGSLCLTGKRASSKGFQYYWLVTNIQNDAIAHTEMNNIGNVTKNLTRRRIFTNAQNRYSSIDANQICTLTAWLSDWNSIQSGLAVSVGAGIEKNSTCQWKWVDSLMARISLFITGEK